MELKKASPDTKQTETEVKATTPATPTLSEDDILTGNFITCPKCKTANSSQAKTCSNCQSSLSDNAPADSEPSGKPAGVKHKPRISHEVVFEAILFILLWCFAYFQEEIMVAILQNGDLTDKLLHYGKPIVNALSWMNQ
jgi:hypothetical protein